MAKFAKGNSGRPAGSRSAGNRILDQLVSDGAETLVKKMIEIAADGDRGAPARARCSSPEYFPLIKSVTSGNYRNILMRMMRCRFSSMERGPRRNLFERAL